MNTTAASYTPLESLLLFQSLLTHGIDAAAFLQISDLLQNNSLVKHSSHSDAGRLSPEALQELFLHLLREELKAESESTEHPDGPGLSPNSKKRKLASPPLPTLQEARQHLAKLPLLVDRLYARYRDHVVREIREDEERYETLQGEIRDLEARELASKDVNTNNNIPGAISAPAGQNGHPPVPASVTPGEAQLPNGAPRTTQPPQQQQPSFQLPAQQQPLTQIQPPQQPLAQPAQPQPQPQLQLQPQPRPLPTQLNNQPGTQFAARPEDARNGTATPQPLPETATPPAPPSQQHPGAPQNQQNRMVASPAAPSPPVRQQELPRPPSGPPQVLQPPQGVGFPTIRQGPVPQQAPAEGLQRPEGIGRGKMSPVSQPSQPTVPGQLKWEPPYQPNQLPPHYRHPPGQAPFPQQRQPTGPQVPQGQQQPAQWNTQTPPPYGSPRPLQAQPVPSPGLPLQKPLQQPLQQPIQQPPQQQQPQQQPSQQMHQPQVQQRVQQPAQTIPQPAQQPAHLPPQNPAQASPALQVAPIRTPTDAVHSPAPGRSPALSQGAAQGRPPQPAFAAQAPYPGYQHPPQSRPLAAASPTHPVGPPQGSVLPQQRTRTPQPIAQRPPPPLQPNAPSGVPPGVPPYAPYSGQGVPPNRLPPRPAIPEHVYQQQPNQQHVGATTPAPMSRVTPANQAPQTPLPPFRPYLRLGSGTSWKLSETPSTPQPDVGDMPSPAYEPLSPVLAPTVLPAVPSTIPSTPSPLPTVTPAPAATPQPGTGTSVPSKDQQTSVSPVAKRRGRPPRNAPKIPDPSLLTPAPQPATSQPAASPRAERQSTKEPDSTIIKHEETTPQPPTEAGDTTADESVAGRRKVSRAVKRKWRDTTSPTPVANQEPPGPPTHVSWTRSFNKVSHSAMEQIVGHRDANLFAHQIRERDAPGYRNRILMPQDLKSIRAAINHGNRAAAAAAAALPGGDPGTSSVLLPISEELVPPKGIINSSQLDRELAHMLANAIMYNPDPNRGPGPAFMRSEAEVDAEDEENGAPVLGYKVDENGIVNNTRAMFVEVEKLLSDMRAAEIQKGTPPTAGGATLTGTSTRQASVAGGGLGETPAAKRDEPGSSSAAAAAAAVADEREEQTPTEPEGVGNVPKRRRITRG